MNSQVVVVKLTKETAAETSIGRSCRSNFQQKQFDYFDNLTITTLVHIF